MRLFRRIVLILFVVITALFIGSWINKRFVTDNKPPVFSCENDVLEVSVSSVEKELLSGITAFDDRDGDLTDKIIVTGVSGLITENTAKATYVVFDSSDNMATFTRTIQYTDYEKPRFVLSSPLIYNIGSTVTLMDRLSATDVIDGDISSSIRVTSLNLSSTSEGLYRITVQVTNSSGDTSILPLTVNVHNYGTSDPLITLSDYLVYVERNAKFEPSSYIVSVRDISEASTVGDNSNVKISGDVDTSKPGVYEVTYTYTSQINRSYSVILTVIVE